MRLSLLCVAWLLSGLAAAAELAPPKKHVCDANGTLNPEKLLIWALYTEAKLPPGLISQAARLRALADEKKTSGPIPFSDALPTTEDMQTMALDPGVCRVPDDRNAGPCGEYGDAQNKLVNRLLRWTTAGDYGADKSTLSLPGGYTAKRVTSPRTALAEHADVSLLAMRPHYIRPMGEFLARNPPLWVVSCEETAAAAPAAGGDPAGAAKAPARSREIRVRKLTEDLVFSQQFEKEKVKGLGSATLSAKNDGKTDKDTIEVKGAIGFALPTRYWGYSSLDQIPFLRIDKNLVKTATEKKPDVSNIGIGIVEHLILANRAMTNELFFNELILTPSYVYSTSTDGSLAQLDAIWRPVPPVTWMRHHVKTGPVRIFVSAGPRVKAGYVINAGNDESLLKAGHFFRYGGQAGISVLGSSGTWLENVAFNLTYVYLKQNGGFVAKVPRLDGTLSYALGDMKNVTLNLSRARGRNLDTLDDEDTWTLGLGFKY